MGDHNHAWGTQAIPVSRAARGVWPGWRESRGCWEGQGGGGGGRRKKTGQRHRPANSTELWRFLGGSRRGQGKQGGERERKTQKTAERLPAHIRQLVMLLSVLCFVGGGGVCVCVCVCVWLAVLPWCDHPRALWACVLLLALVSLWRRPCARGPRTSCRLAHVPHALSPARITPPRPF